MSLWLLKTPVLVSLWLWSPRCRCRGKTCCLCGCRTSLLLPSGYDSGVRKACICPGDWWWGGTPFFTNYGPFLMLVNAQKIKAKSVFHEWGTKWFKTGVIMTYFRVKNQFLLQQRICSFKARRRGRRSMWTEHIRKAGKGRRDPHQGDRVGFCWARFYGLSHLQKLGGRWTSGSFFSSISSPQRLH